MKILFAGTPRFAAQHLSGLLSPAQRHRDSDNIEIIGVITQPDKPGKRGKSPIPSETKRVAQQHQIPVIQPEKLTAEHLQPFNADLLIVVAYGQILNPEVLLLPAYGCINVHGSLLPRWRGAAPIQRAILAGDEQTGICIIQLDQGLDTGNILATRSIPLENTDTTASLSDKLSELGIAGLIEVCNKIRLGLTEPVVQTEEGTCYAHKISKEEANIDWDASSITVGRSIRAFYPDPVCYTFLGSMRIKLLKASMSHSDSIQRTPGKVLEVSKRGVDVACGTGSILLEQVQLPIGKGSILTGADILNARSELIFAGVTFTRSAAEI